MRSLQIDGLLSAIRRWRFAVMLLQCAVILGSGWAVWELSRRVEEKYLFHHPVAFALVPASLLLPFLCRSVVLYLSEDGPKTARRLDQSYHLQDRLTTYNEIRNSPHPFLAALSGETETRIAGLSAFRASRIERGSAAPAMFLFVVLAAIAALPYLPVPQKITSQKEQQKQIHQQAKALTQQLAKLEKESIRRPELKKLLDEFRKTIKELQKPDTDKVEALKQLNTLQDKLKLTNQDLEKSLAEKLEQDLPESNAGKPETNGMDAPRIEEMIKEFQKAAGKDLRGGNEIADSLKQKQWSKQEIDQIKQALDKYKSEKAQSEKTMTEYQRSLENAKEKIGSGKRTFVTDSRLSERDLERGKGGVNDGPGTTNLDLGPQSFDTSKKEQGTSMEDRTKTEYEKSYKGEREKAGRDPLYLNSRWNDTGNPGYTRIRTFGLEGNKESRNTPSEIASQDSGESQIQKEKVPASYRKIVKKYFESIEKND